MKATTKPLAEIIDLTVPVASATLYQKGLEHAIDVSKVSLNLAIQQNQEMLAAIKNALKGAALPGMFILDLAAQAFAGYVTVQVKLLDLALQQSNASIQVLKNFGQDGNVDMAELQASLDRSVAAGYTVLDFTAEQTKAVSLSVKQQPGIAGTPAEALADSVQHSFDTALGMQKEMLNIAVKPLKASVARA